MSDKSDKARSLNGDFTGGYAHLYIQALLAESVKGGMLMKSKHCIYEKKTVDNSFCSNHCYITILHKSAIAAPDTGSYCIK